ncbi:MAG TPA: hypothetical protein VGB53_10875 [Rubricoccaceae bacterium]|jgi:hypothetical protein
MARAAHLPTVGVIAALGLFAVAASHYPGSPDDPTATPGYHWAHDFVSALFRPEAAGGAPNAARGVAVAAMLVLCASVGTAFYRLSQGFSSRRHRKTVEIAGIGTAVYSVLAVTPMHDLMVDVGLLSGLTALAAATHALYAERRWALAAWGAGCLALLALSAAMYYGHLLYEYLPLAQKVSLLASVAWLLGAYYGQIGRRAPRMSAHDGLASHG